MSAITTRISIFASVVFTGGLFFAAFQGSKDMIFSAGLADITTEHLDLMSPRTLGWDDLLPDDFDVGALSNNKPNVASIPALPFQSLRVDHTGMTSSLSTQPIAKARKDLADTVVRISGYMTPLAVENGRTRAFLLVPYVGACIHVPPPPSNQIVLVESAEPIDVRQMWEPFNAVGVLRVENANTGLASVSYTMQLDRVEEYGE